MTLNRVVWILGLSALVVVGSVRSEDRISGRVDFNRDIKPLLSDRCFACHGPDANQRKADLRLDLESSAKRDLGGYFAVVAGRPSESLIVERLLSEDPDEVMPPPDVKKALSREEIALIEQWIAEGADWANHWSFEPISRPVPPQSDPLISRNPIDRFVRARLMDEGIEPSPEASREVLIRRVTLDLTGLPTTPEETDAFLRDHSSGAYERVVDRLLQSHRYGEHMARFWLDAARYGDTHGLHLDNYREMWPYRDWVVNAFNRNLSYRDFVIEQLAGDLLPNPTREQLVATGFNRCNVTTGEGGSIKEEVYVRNAVDRVVTTSTVFMGLTLECTRCHDHKFDPLTMKDFYSFFAYFNSIDGDPMDGNRKEHAPILRLPSSHQTEQLERYAGLIDSLEARVGEPWDEVDQGQEEWEVSAIAAIKKAGEKSSGLTLTDWYTVGPFRDARLYLLPRKHGPEGKPISLSESFKLVTNETVTWKRRQDWKDGVVQTDFGGDTAANFLYRKIESADDRTLQISLGSGDGIKVYLNGNEILSKDVEREAAADQELIELDLKQGTNELLVKLVNYGGKTGFYFSMIDGVGDLSEEIRAILKRPSDEREDKERVTLRTHYRNKISEYGPLVEANSNLKQYRESRAAVDRAVPLTLVWKERKEPRKAYLLKRGNYDQRGEEVGRATPAALPPFLEGEPKNRLGLARWLTDDRNPLTARVAVNRFWQQLFGVGLVKTAEDFGSQGEPPSHPELLDWLASRFRESGWDVKALMKAMVMSGTYRQSSKMTPASIERDPQNRLLARGPRFRLDAEMLRDQALFVSDLLIEIQGGSSVKPPQPDGLWFAVGYSGSNTVKFVADQGPEKVHRRTLYTFVKRTSPPPQMSTFDGPSREACVMRRERTNTPMQALLLLNDPQYVETARALAERAMKENGLSDADRAEWMFRRCVGRFASPLERDELVSAFHEEREYYTQNEAAAASLATIGDSEADSSLAGAELAAWASVASLLLNLDEVLTKN